VNNILEGLIWFWVPASLVICNDIFAYICGVTMGRTPLIALSPKKTVEGFVGAFVCTVLFSLAWGTYFMRFDYMVCPAQDLGTSAFSAVTCLKNPVFIWRDAPFPAGIAAFLSTMVGRSLVVAQRTVLTMSQLGRAVTTFPYAPYQIHLLAMSSFASLAAPFGGFFASGFKRAFNIKDFGDSIPGHGGMTDRMDCQCVSALPSLARAAADTSGRFLMGVFAYVYYSSLIRQHLVTVGAVMQTVTSGLSPEDQLQLLVDLRRYIEGQGIVIGS
jgi:phosphatidate cytidylyltransferase